MVRKIFAAANLVVDRVLLFFSGVKKRGGGGNEKVRTFLFFPFLLSKSLFSQEVDTDRKREGSELSCN
jgi:hypothetical protein